MSVGRRAVELVIVLFAILGFAFVPLGGKTGLEHALFLARSQPARQLATGLLAALSRAVDRAQENFRPRPVDDSEPVPVPTGENAVEPVPPPLPKTAKNGSKEATGREASR
ncbi:MAG TPA: hypothetical protein VKY73_22075 [Polyangiaceae bacterium]|nr:hypothetical protein [Polyangiaceae bacterium]